MRFSSRLWLAGALLALGGCATTGTTVPTARPDPRDPLERINRATFRFNEAIDRSVARPVARGYRFITPDAVEHGVSNFFSNAAYPTVLVNNLLQGKFKDAVSDSGRLLLNLTFGLGGLLDPASDVGLARNDEDFGQTLGRWGVGSGAYLMVPFLGPYTVRDGLGSLADEFTEPRQYLEDDSTRWTLWAGKQLDKRARLLEADSVLAQAGDKYVLVRSAYLQRREFLVRDGDVPMDEMLDEEGMTDEPVEPTESVDPVEPAGDTPPAPPAPPPASQPPG